MTAPKSNESEEEVIQPRVSIRTQSSKFDYDIEANERLAGIEIDGKCLIEEVKELRKETQSQRKLMEAVLEGNEIVRTTQSENRASRALLRARMRVGYFLFGLATFGIVVFCFWAIPQINWFKNRLSNLPGDTSALQRVMATTGERKFQVGHIVLNQNGEKMVVLGANLLDDGWLYKLKKLRHTAENGYVIKSTADFYLYERFLGPVMLRGSNAFFDMKKLTVEESPVAIDTETNE